MKLNNLYMIFKMISDYKVIRFLNQVYRVMKKDKKFKLIKGIKGTLHFLKGEKLIEYNKKYILSTFMPPFPSKAFMNFLTATSSPKTVFTDQAYSKRTAPISIYLSLTKKCPFNCFHCSAKGLDNSKELTTDQWINVIKDLQNMKTSIIGLTGGEPLLRNDIEKIISSIDERSTSILFTSGKGLTIEKAVKLKKAGLHGIGISLDSADKQIHNNKRRNKDAFDYSINAVKTSRKAGLYTMVQTVFLKKDINEKYMFNLFALSKKLGAHEVKILEPLRSGNLLTKEEMDDVFYDENAKNKLIKIQHKANKKNSFPKITTFAYTESKNKFGCGAGSQHSYINANGDLTPCDFIPLSFGNIKKDSIIKLWKNMNKIIGNPKTKCFANTIYSEILDSDSKSYPIPVKKSIDICSKHQSGTFPKFYSDMQK